MESFSEVTRSSQESGAPERSRCVRKAALAIQEQLNETCDTNVEAVGHSKRIDLYTELSSVISVADSQQMDCNDTLLNLFLTSYLDCYRSIGGESKFIVAAVLLAYDIIRRRDACLQQSEWDFIARIFDEHLSVKGPLDTIIDVVQGTMEQFTVSKISFENLNALFVLEAHLSEAALRTELQQESATNSDATLVEPLASKTKRFGPSGSITASRNVHIQYYLNPGCELKVDNVTSIDFAREALIMSISGGHKVRIEEGVIVSDVKGMRKTVEIRAPTADGFDLSATIVVAQGSNHMVPDVTSIGWVDEMQDWTVLETPKATVWVGNGPYVVQRDGTSLLVNNV